MAKITYKLLDSVIVIIAVMPWILTMVIAKPIQLTMVSAVPFSSAGAFWATRVENNGESAITTMPQNIRNPTNKLGDPLSKTIGETKQHAPDKNNAIKAVRLVPTISDIYPPKTQASPPILMITNDNKGILKFAVECDRPYFWSIMGTKAQKA